MVAGTKNLEELSDSLIHSFPDIDIIFAYGSGIFHQPDLYNAGQEPVLDFIFGVRNPLSWHQQNLKINGEHYSGLITLGTQQINFLSRKVGVGIYFNTHVLFEGKMIKYGVIDMGDLVRDLETWENFYISGRLQKPVRWIKGKELIKKNQDINLTNAFATALLTLPLTFTKYELYSRICGLSYLGDIRMKVAEDSRKVERIVSGNFLHFENLYRPILAKMSDTLRDDGANMCHQKTDIETRSNLFLSLPKGICGELGFIERDCLLSNKDFLKKIENNTLTQELLNVISKRVARSSRRQLMVGFLSSGILKSSIYLYNKFKKAWRNFPL